MITIHLDPCMYQCGSWGIYWYGLCIALALGLYLWLVKRDRLIRRVFAENFDNVVLRALLGGIVGARLIHLVTDSSSYAQVWEYFLIARGGLSMWGGVLGVLVVAWSQVYYRAQRWSILDRFALYAPLLHAISRIGCFLAGCCHGIIGAGVLGCVMYTHPHSLAQVLDQPVVPTQLVSSMIYMMLAAALIGFRRYILVVPGLALCLYVTGVSVERWLVDWWRFDRIMDIPNVGFASTYLSFHQWLSIGIILIAGGIGYYLIRSYQKDVRI
jgi:phosphatidylglycerol---prolipoprotein diacylglyceryl transferase